MNSSLPHDLIPSAEILMQRYWELREYVELEDQDVKIAVDSWPLVQAHVVDVVEDFYAEVMRHPNAAAVLRGGQEQVERLKQTLRRWLEQLFEGNYNEEFVRNRWIVGWRHVKIGLSQVWTATAMSRLRDQLLNRIVENWHGTASEYSELASAISRLMDLDLALIQDAYHAEAVAVFLQSEKEFNEAIIGTTQSIVLVLDESNRLLRSNAFLARLIGGNDELSPRVRSLNDLIFVDDHSVLEQLLEATTLPVPSGPVTARLVTSDARQRTVRWFARTMHSPLVSLDGVPQREVQKILVGHDVTDLSEAQRKMVQQERLAAIGQTMAGLAHESRNAFQRSQAALETLALELTDRPDAVELLGRIQRANDHLLHLYEEVLQFAKPVRLDLKRCDLTEIAQATCRHVSQATNCDQQRLIVQTIGQIPPVLADHYAVEQILRNLVENALVVSPENKPVIISICAAWQGDQPSLRVEVTDRGPGIEPELIDRVFEPFFSTRSRGTGLGLPIARRLAEAHGGSLELITGSHGTTAVLILPEVSSGDQTLDPEDRPDMRRGVSR